MTVKLRFAPSPTGYLHVGNIRTALVNYLFARKQGGVFVLRMDDTDTQRSEDKYAVAIKEDLRWLGLDWDETFRQTSRQNSYDAAIEKLKQTQRIYPCYETAQELELKRKVQLSRGLPPTYDRAALALTDGDIKAFDAEGRTPHWRFRLDHETVEWIDEVRGEVAVDLTNLSDPVLIRGDGSLLYTLPSVVDDIDHQVTHVFRGEDHVTNTAAQVQIYRALGGEVPTFAHFALLTGAGGEGLSKRLGTLSIRDLRAQGLEAMAINSLLARIGTSAPVEPFTVMEDLIKGFDLQSYGRSAAKFDPAELDLLNAKMVHRMSYEQVSDRIVDISAELWTVIRPNLEKLSDAENWLKVVEGPVTPVIGEAEFLAAAADLLPGGALNDESWPEWTEALKKATGRTGKALFMPLRQALTGLDHGPEMKLLLPLIGRERTEARLRGETA